MRNIHLVSILAAAALAACAAEPTTDSGSSALTAEQCNYFAVDGKVQICHRTGSDQNPYKILKISDQALGLAGSSPSMSRSQKLA